MRLMQTLGSTSRARGLAKRGVTQQRCVTMRAMYGAHERWERAAELAAPYLAEHAETYAGDWVSEDNGGEYHVAFTDDVEEHRRALEAIMRDPGVLHVHQGRFVLAELSSLQRRIAADRAELAQEGLYVSSTLLAPDTRLRLRVIAPDSDRAEALLRSRYGDAIRVDYLGPDRFVVEPSRWQGCYAIEPDGRTLTVSYRTNCCYELERVDHSANEREIRVTILERKPVDFETQAACKRRLTIQLEAPLGARAIIDAASGEQRAPCTGQPVVTPLD